MGEERIIPQPPFARCREGEILKEVPSEVLSIVLWQDVRHLRDWAESSPVERAFLFHPHPPQWVLTKRNEARALAGELAGALRTFWSVVTSPLSVDAKVVGAACAEVVDWALAREYVQTAIEWAEVAAIVDPNNPRLANLAGRVTRNANEYERSEIWFRRGIGYAREQDDKVELTRGHLGYGTLCKEMGRVQCARSHLNSGSQLARKNGPPSLAAEAQHDLAAFLMVRGHLSEAEKRARRALRLYPKNHHRLPLFAADVALMCVLGCQFHAAARVLKGVLRVVDEPTPRTVILALLTRALAGAGQQEEATVFHRRALKLLQKHRGLEPVTRWHLADAQRLAGRWERAQADAETALAVSLDENDHEIERLTRQLLDELRRQAPGLPNVATPTPEFRAFVRTLIQRLADWSPRRARSSRTSWGSDWAA